jgi:hypothetical protein
MWRDQARAILDAAPENAEFLYIAIFAVNNIFPAFGPLPGAGWASRLAACCRALLLVSRRSNLLDDFH